MNAWMMLWSTVLIAVLVSFSGLTIAVTIGGALDIRRMLRQLRRQHETAETNVPS